MQALSHFAIAALLALTWSGLASAESPDANPSIESGLLASVTEMKLDQAIEESGPLGSDDFLRGLAGPSSMDCTHAVTRSDFETCIVSVEGSPRTAVPAALAQH
jgi:hypothetical protein